VVLLGAVVRDPGDWFKLLLILVLLAGTSPVAAAATARAVTRAGEEPETGS
jgi:multisubunit Na+/H+ antiporter MnhG subunit